MIIIIIIIIIIITIVIIRLSKSTNNRESGKPRLVPITKNHSFCCISGV